MHLDKLELLGFKSFPEKTVLKFSPGISCIVGPNGCGKTNVLDAIRWVLGETRMSILRGGKLEEVIFSGTREIKPLGMAEVNLTIHNDKGILASPYSQITITRRLYRSGDSEFFINKVPCRLKDITEMFFDTGLTSGTYSVIEQDMIDIILSDKAEDRRHFFEEACGITKYKQRKKEALRKLESTEADLLRLADLYSEVSSQAGSLRRQVSKAEKHKQLQDNIQLIGTRLAIDRWIKIETMVKQLAIQNENLQTELESVKGQENVLELDREKMRLFLVENEEAIRAKREKLTQLTEKLHNLETQISVQREKSKNDKNRHTQITDEISSLESRSEALVVEAAECEKKTEDYENQVSELKSRVDEGEEELSRMIGTAQKLSNDYEDLQNQIKKSQRELNESQENQITLDLKYSAGLEKISEIGEAVDSMQQEIKSLQHEKERLQLSKDDLSIKLRELENLRDSQISKLSGLKDEIQNLQDQHNKLTSDYHHLSAEIELAGKVIHQYEGYSSGAAQIGRIKEQFPGIIDTVANIITPQEEYIVCVQTVLGELSNYFVVDTQSTAKKVLEYGQKKKFGRFGLIILENIPEPSDPDVTFTNNPNIIGQLSKFVRAEDKYSRLVNYLFKDIFVARDLFEEKGLPGFDLVSPQGEMLDFGKSLAVGGSEEMLLVGQRSRLQELLKNKDRLKRETAEISAKVESGLKHRTELESDLAGLSERVMSLKEEMASISANLSQVNLKLEAVSSLLTERKQTKAELESRLHEIDSEKSGLSQILSSKRKQLEDLEHESKALKQKLEKAGQARDEFSRELSGLKMKLFSAESSLTTSQGNHKRLIELIDDIERNLEDKTRHVNDLILNIVNNDRLVKRYENDLKTIYKEKEEASQILMKAEGEISEISGKINELDKNLKQQRLKSADLSEKMHQIGIKTNSLTSQKETLAADTLERYKCDLTAQSRIIELSDEDRDRLKEELGDLKDKLEGIGPVNLLALDEYEQTKTRADFLKNQIDDLNKAKEDLKLTITRINSTARKKFLETFKIVRENFQNVFSELFEGGEANLRLEENVDPLEASIHISARPRGKKLLSIHQLSGGERALTATALLFSFYMVKPSPFCILDEVDAPLDDANIGRFLKLIKRFTENTQFIIITHNKLTMEEAGTLYGITMAKPGISQIVSVDLGKMEQDLQTSLDIDQQTGLADAEVEEKGEVEQETEKEVEVGS